MGRRRWHFAGRSQRGDWSTISGNPAVTLLGVPDAQRWPGRTTEQGGLLRCVARTARKGRGALRHRGGQSTIRGPAKSGNQTARSLRSVDVDGGVACGGRMGTCILPANASLHISKAGGSPRRIPPHTGKSGRPAIEVSQSRYKDVATADTVVSRQPVLSFRRSLSLAFRVRQVTHQSDTQVALAPEIPVDAMPRPYGSRQVLAQLLL